MGSVSLPLWGRFLFLPRGRLLRAEVAVPHLSALRGWHIPTPGAQGPGRGVGEKQESAVGLFRLLG